MVCGVGWLIDHPNYLRFLPKTVGDRGKYRNVVIFKIDIIETKSYSVKI